MEKTVIINKLKEIGLNVKTIENVNAGTDQIYKYLIKTLSEKYILKILPNWISHEELQEKINIMRKLNETEKISVYPIHSKPLNFENRFGYTYKFAKGIELSKLIYNDLSTYEYEYGRCVGKFHKLGKKITPCSHKSIHWKRTLKIVKKNLELVKIDNNLRIRYKKLLQSISDILLNNFDRRISCKTQLVHGDIHISNIIVSSQNKCTIIDMDYLSSSHIGIDLAACFIGTKQTTPVTNKFLLGYNTENKLTKNEVHTIPLFALLRLLNWVDDDFKYNLSNIDKRLLFFNERLKSIKYFINVGF